MGFCPSGGISGVTMLDKNLSYEPETAAAPRNKNGFFRAVAQTFKTNRLGDLLVGSGLITAQQLDAALEEQALTRRPLGSILIHQKALTAVQLYQKLAEQWCLRAATAGVTFLMQTALPTPAHAQEHERSGGVSAEFTLASAGSHNAIRHYPQLFGTTETRSNDITAFKKWTDVMQRFENQMHSASSSSPRVMMWKSEIQRLQGKSQREQIEGVNAFMNDITYIEDSDNYSKTDYWATPLEFLSRGGDCEDFAIAKYASLRALGFSTDQLRVAIVTDKIKNIPHAILIVYADDGTFVLDNQSASVKSASAVDRYDPIFSINSTSWWRHHA